MNSQPLPVPGPRDVLRILRRHGKKAGLFALATVCIVAVYMLVITPKTYQSTAKLFFRVGRETIGLDPTAITSETVQVRTSRAEEINSALEMLKSRTVLEKVVDVLGPRKILEKPQQSGSLSKVLSLKGLFATSEGLFATKDGAAAGDPATADLDRGRAIKSLGRSLDFDAPKETTVIAITCKAASPETAQSIVAAVVDCYTEEHMRLNRTAGSLEFFAEQAELVHQQLVETAARADGSQERTSDGLYRGRPAVASSQDVRKPGRAAPDRAGACRLRGTLPGTQGVACRVGGNDRDAARRGHLQ